MADQASSRIVIVADKSAIMNVIADFPAYPEWAGYMKTAEVVEDGPGGRAKQVRFVLDAGVIKDDYVLAYDWSGDDEVSWRLVKGNVLKDMDGTYALTDAGDGQTEVTYRLAVDLKIPMIGLIRRKAEKVIIDTALKELKKRVER
jgi:ribosome-associated toxin RatA of RatAB toxin-antitoxin module